MKHVRDRRATKRLSRTTLATSVAAQRAVAGLSSDEVAGLPTFIGTSTGITLVAPFLEELAREERPRERLVDAIFSGGGGNALEYLKYSVNLTAGTLAEHTGVRGSNATFNGVSAGYLALLAAVRLLLAQRARTVLVAGGESLLERPPREADGTVRPLQLPRELGCALLLSTRSADQCPRLHLEAVAEAAASEQAVTHFEALNCLGNLCWALENTPQGGASWFLENDRRGRRLTYGISV